VLGAVYLAAETAAVVGRHPVVGTPSRRWVAAAALAVTGVAVAGPAVDDAVAIASGVVVPFLAGQAATVRGRLAAAATVAVPVALGLVAIDPPPIMVGPRCPAVVGFTAYSLAVGAPLYAVGREWRARRRADGTDD
jgi:hypothetical protein